MLLLLAELPPFEFVLEAKATGGGGGDASCAGPAALAVCTVHCFHCQFLLQCLRSAGTCSCAL